jgi:amidase
MSMWIIKEATSGPGPRVAVKDLIDVAGWPTTAGCPAVAERAQPAATDAACLAGLRVAIARGEACLAGKTTLHELAYGITGINAAFGTPVNPLDPTRVPGGSSSGSAVAVASGQADVAYGSDTGGSIRIPAACCGVAGLKTTWSRIPLTGVWPLAPSLDTVGPMARDVAGLVTGMALLEPGFTVTASQPRVVGRVMLDADPAVDQAVDAALAAAGWEVVPIELAGLGPASSAAMTVLDAEAWASDGELTETAPEQIGRDVLNRLRQAAAVTPAQLSAAWDEAARWRASLSALWDQVDLLALPTLLGFPPTLGNAREMLHIRGITAPVNLAGVPALALPVPSGGPLPASVQLIGPANGEDHLLAAGAVLEQAVQDLSGLAGLAGGHTGAGGRSLLWCTGPGRLAEAGQQDQRHRRRRDQYAADQQPEPAPARSAQASTKPAGRWLGHGLSQSPLHPGRHHPGWAAARGRSAGGRGWHAVRRRPVTDRRARCTGRRRGLVASAGGRTAGR